MRLRTVMVAVVAASATLLTFTASAIEFHHPEGPFVVMHHCTCRLDGQDVELGERRCLKTATGPKAATCVMEQNVTSWRPSGEECPQASLYTPRS